MTAPKDTASQLGRRRRYRMTSYLAGAAAVVTGAALLVTSAVTTTAASASDHMVMPSRLSQLRAATDNLHDIARAEKRGYAVLRDTAGIACIAMPGQGAMGIHWADAKLVGDPAIHLLRPEAMVYAPDADGTLRLAAVEYVTIKSAWDATHAHRPHLFGHQFQLTPAPNRFGLPAFYSLHVWAWKVNPAGMFSMWNPKVSCRNA